MSLKSSLDTILSRRFGSNVDDPGVQVTIVKDGQIVYEGAIGLAKVVCGNCNEEREQLTTSHRSNLYSGTKFFTACSVLKLIEDGKLQPNDKVQALLCRNFSGMSKYIPEDITVEDLIAHQSGAPNPLPLQWVHSPNDIPSFDEMKCLMDVLTKNTFRQRSSANDDLQSSRLPYAYSNVGYWLLGPIVTNSFEEGTKTSEFTSCCQQLLNLPTSMSHEFDTTQPTAHGHVSLWSPLALAAYFFCPRKLIGPCTWKWIRMEPHYIDGTAYGGFIGSSRDVATWLGQLLKGDVLSSTSLHRLFEPVNSSMTFGLHIKNHNGQEVYHKEGGGAGCHSSIQIRPKDKLAGCVIAGDASFDVNGMLDELLDYVQQH